MAVRKKGLGKGLDSLIPDNKPVKSVTAVKEEESEPKSGEQMVKLNMVEPNREQTENFLRKTVFLN